MSNDSVVYIETFKIDTVILPGETIYKSIPVDVLKYDTIIEYRSKTSSAKIESKSGILSFTSVCDSLEKLVISTQSKLERLSKSSINKQVVQKKVKGVPWWYKASFFLVIAAVVIWLIKRYLKFI